MNPENTLQKLQDLRAAKSVTQPDLLKSLFDEGQFVELDGYTANDGVVIGYGYVEGCPVYAFMQTGPVGMMHAKKLEKIYQMAETNGCPLLGIYNSNGGYIAEGHDLLAAYGGMLHAANRLSGVVPQISVITGVCAGSAAVLAATADVVIMSENEGEFFLTPPFTAKANGEAQETGTANAAAKSGAVHLTAKTAEKAVEQARLILSMLPTNNLAPAPICEFSASEATPAASDDIANVCAAIADANSVVELQSEFGTAAYTALATLGGQTVGLIGAKDDLDKDAVAKIARFVSFLDAFNLAVVTLVDSNGFVQSAADEAAGSVRQIARLAQVYAEATSPKLTVLTGKAYGAAFITMAGKNAGADLTVAWPNAVITALPPVTAAEFLWHDKLAGAENLTEQRNELADKYAAENASPFVAAEGGYIDDIVLPEETRGTLLSALDLLSGKRVSNLPKKHGSIYC